MNDVLALLGDRQTIERLPAFTIVEADLAGTCDYHRLRREVFVDEQAMFDRSDSDDHDDDPRMIVLVARNPSGAVLGGVRLGPAGPGADIGWWFGGRLVVGRNARDGRSIGGALVRAACARAEVEGVLRFDATVQPSRQRFFTRLGWHEAGRTQVAGAPHVVMRWPIGRVQALVAATKAPLGALLDGLTSDAEGFLGDDGAPVPGFDMVAACDAISPEMVERDPGWAGWCSVVVNVNDLAAMGARPVGLLDAVAARTASHARRVLAGLRAASQAYGVPVLGGHTQLGVPAALSVTALGHTAVPVPAAGGRPGQEVRLTADLAGGWRPGYAGRQWDSTTSRSPEDLRAMVAAIAVGRPAAAKDVSMAGVAGTLGMLAEASGCGAELDVARVPRPAAASVGDWFTCFPGFAMLSASPGPSAPLPAGPAVSAACGRLTDGHGVRLRWPDGVTTPAVTGSVTGLGPARGLR